MLTPLTPQAASWMAGLPFPYLPNAPLPASGPRSSSPLVYCGSPGKPGQHGAGGTPLKSLGLTSNFDSFCFRPGAPEADAGHSGAFILLKSLTPGPPL